VRYLLDTDACVWLLRGQAAMRARVRAASPDDLAISSMTEAELRFGALKSSDPARNLARVEALLSAPLAILPFDRGAARRHAEARFALRARPIGERDLVIASTALAHGLSIVTGNVRELGRVPELEVEDWTGG
jgi:tRNA(fMet)-specific endonuclease VapC